MNFLTICDFLQKLPNKFVINYVFLGQWGLASPSLFIFTSTEHIEEE